MKKNTFIREFADFELANMIVQQYFKNYGIFKDLEMISSDSEISVWGNEFLEFCLSDRNGNGFLELRNVELNQGVHLCFYVPILYNDFIKVMKILNPQQ